MFNHTFRSGIKDHKQIEAFIDFVYKADAGEWDDEVVDLAAEAWGTRRNILENRSERTRLLMNNVENTIFCGFIIRCIPTDVKLRYYLTYGLKRLEGTQTTKTGGSILQMLVKILWKA